MNARNSDPRLENKGGSKSFPWQFTFFLSSLTVGMFIFLLKLFEVI